MKEQGELTDELMTIRKPWTLEDFEEAYGDEWEVMPNNLADCFAEMEEWVFYTYDTDYLKEVIENEQPKTITMKMKVQLASVGNPDHGQDPDQPMWGCEPDRLVEVSSMKEARNECMKFKDNNDLGGGNWSGGQIFEDGKMIARVSPNGRVWEVKEGESEYASGQVEIIIV